ncbi:MAG: preprotein translocase subunit YajC [Pirellulales bacterium]
MPLADGLGDVFKSPLLPLVFIGLFLWMLVIRPERRKQSTHRQMLEGIKKNDRIVTIGGIRGTVISVNRDVDEVVVRVDDSAKLRMTFGAIARIEGEGANKDDARKIDGA